MITSEEYVSVTDQIVKIMMLGETRIRTYSSNATSEHDFPTLPKCVKMRDMRNILTSRVARIRGSEKPVRPDHRRAKQMLNDEAVGTNDCVYMIAMSM